MAKNIQIDFWKGDFGKKYTDRCSFSVKEMDEDYKKAFGKTRIEMNNAIIGKFSRDARILEVGCNTGMQLRDLQRMGFKNLYGIELQPYAVELSKKYTKGINIICGSGFDLPFKDGFFDVVCTNGVLIHIAPKNLPKIMSEMYRCSKKYIWGFEYYASKMTDINYRGHKNRLWKADYASIFIKNFTNLKLVKREFYKYTNNQGNTDVMYLLKK